MAHDIIMWLGHHFSPEQYLFWTRVECLAWTAADVLIVFFLIRLANLVRGLQNRRQHLFSYILLGLTLLPVPLIVNAQTGWAIFTLEVLVTVPHFLLILYIMWADGLLLHDVLCPEFFSKRGNC
jgi:hypothetical protein